MKISEHLLSAIESTIVDQINGPKIFSSTEVYIGFVKGHAVKLEVSRIKDTVEEALGYFEEHPNMRLIQDGD